MQRGRLSAHGRWWGLAVFVATWRATLRALKRCIVDYNPSRSLQTPPRRIVQRSFTEVSDNSSKFLIFAS